MLHLTPYFTAYLLVVTALLGLVFGSFGNAWAWRVVHGEPISRGRSHCAACGHPLSARDLVPLVSFLALGGKCRYCGETISPRYPAAEAVCALIFLSFVLRFDLTLYTLALCILGFLLLVLSLVDLESLLIPNRFLALAVVNFIVFTCLLSAAPVKGLLAGLLGGLALAVPLLLLVLLADHVLGRETMGGGDIKLLFVLGLYVGPARGLLLVILACVIGLLMALVPAFQGRDAEHPRAVPFGPSLALAAWIVLLWGEPFVRWYLSLF